MTQMIETAPAATGTRVTLARLLAALGALFVLFVAGGAIAPVVGFADPDQMHAFHDVGWGALTGVLFGGSMVAVAVKPEWRLPLVYALGHGIALTVVGIVADSLLPEMLVFVALPVVIGVVRGGSWSDGRLVARSRRMAAVAAVSLLAGLYYAADQYQRQINAGAADEHAEFRHYVAMAVFGLVAPYAAFLASTKLRGWRALGWLAGAAAVLVAAGSLAIDQMSRFPTWTAWVTGIVGLGFIALTENEARSR